MVTALTPEAARLRIPGPLGGEIAAHLTAAIALSAAAKAAPNLTEEYQLTRFAFEKLHAAATLVVGFLPTTTPDDAFRLEAESIVADFEA